MPDDYEVWHRRARAQFLIAVVADILGDVWVRGAMLSRGEGRQVQRILDEASAIANAWPGAVHG
jgi:hypothetical protein